MNIISALEVELSGDTDVIVRRDFRAPPARVWRALTEPALVQQWMWAYDWPMSACEIDLREGGAYRWTWTGPDGASFGFNGTYLKLRPHSLIVHTELFNGDPATASEVTTELRDTVNGTSLTMTIRYDSAEARKAALATGMTDGMEETYKKLDALLAAG